MSCSMATCVILQDKQQNDGWWSLQSRNFILTVGDIERFCLWCACVSIDSALEFTCMIVCSEKQQFTLFPVKKERHVTSTSLEDQKQSDHCICQWHPYPHWDGDQCGITGSTVLITVVICQMRHGSRGNEVLLALHLQTWVIALLLWTKQLPVLHWCLFCRVACFVHTTINFPFVSFIPTTNGWRAHSCHSVHSPYTFQCRYFQCR